MCPGNHDFGFLGNFFDLLTRDQALMFDRFASSLMVDTTSSAGEFFCGVPTSYANKYSSVARITKTGFTRVISVIGLDSNRPAAEEFAARGRIGDQQLINLEVLLSIGHGGRPGLVQIVCLHHHPVPLRRSNIEFALTLVDADKFRKVIRGKVDLVLFGHKHFQTKGVRDGYQWLSSGASPKESLAHEIIVGPHGIRCSLVRTR